MRRHKHKELRIFRSKYDLKPFYGCMWISYNGGYGTGFWQQITNRYTSVNRLKRYNEKFKHIDF